jgi:hypothetical protein
MMPRALAGLLGLGLLLIGTISLELIRGVADEGAMIASPESAAPPGPAVSSLKPRSGRQALVDGILARPLFTATRRPAVRLAGPAAAPANQPRLTGILINGSSRSVIFAAPEGGRPVVAQEGAQVGGYTVTSIEAGQVTLSGPDGTRTLRPAFDARPKAASGPSAAGAPAPFATATDVLQSLRGLPGFSGIAR